MYVLCTGERRRSRHKRPDASATDSNGKEPTENSESTSEHTYIVACINENTVETFHSGVSS